METDRVDYRYGASGRFEIRIVRYITIHLDSNWISYDTANVQYIRFQSIEQAQQICEMLGIQEYEIEEYPVADDDHIGHGKTAYRTPLAQQAINALQKQYEERQLRDKLIRLENNKKLESIPNRETIKTFSNGMSLLRLVNTGKNKVYCHYQFINDNYERELYLSHYITKGTSRFLKKKFTEDLSRLQITEEEINDLINSFDSLRKYSSELNSMLI